MAAAITDRDKGGVRAGLAAMRKLLTILNARMRDHLADLELAAQNLQAAQ